MYTTTNQMFHSFKETAKASLRKKPTTFTWPDMAARHSYKYCIHSLNESYIGVIISLEHMLLVLTEQKGA